MWLAFPADTSLLKSVRSLVSETGLMKHYSSNNHSSIAWEWSSKQWHRHLFSSPLCKLLNTNHLNEVEILLL